VSAPWVVVGAGSAGCVLGARLSEDERREVVLVESGPALEPGAVPAEVTGSNFLATANLRDRNDAGLLARRVRAGEATIYRRGRGVGGSSVVNAMVALHGDPALYRSWGWDDVERMWEVVAVPEQLPGDDELGPVDLALLAADVDAQRAPLTRRGRKRVTSAEAYLWPALDRPNLSIRSDSEVTRVVIEDRRAVGVVLSTGEEIAAERVIVSAGAIRTPALLLRSGLDTPGIGLGLQDHPSVPLTLALRDGVSVDADGLVIGALRQRDGVQFLPMNHLGADAPGFGLLLVALMTPRGRSGSVRIDPEGSGTSPLVDFALLDDPADLRALARAVGDALRLLRTAPFRDIVDEILIDGVGTTSDELSDDEAIERWLPSAVGDYVHASSSCAMGVVVDDDGAVVGYRSLYVCDASVFPTIPDVNTHMPTTMLAERLSARWRRGHP
jgi:choline dehydrogenase-like flavoprotein